MSPRGLSVDIWVKVGGERNTGGLMKRVDWLLGKRRVKKNGPDEQFARFQEL